jgi:hypothetical protein
VKAGLARARDEVSRSAGPRWRMQTRPRCCLGQSCARPLSKRRRWGLLRALVGARLGRETWLAALHERSMIQEPGAGDACSGYRRTQDCPRARRRHRHGVAIGPGRVIEHADGRPQPRTGATAAHCGHREHRGTDDTRCPGAPARFAPYRAQLRSASPGVLPRLEDSLLELTALQCNTDDFF